MKGLSALNMPSIAVAAREVVALASMKVKNGEKNHRFSLHGMKGFSRLVDTYMRDSELADDLKIMMAVSASFSRPQSP